MNQRSNREQLCQTGLELCAWLQSPAATRLPDLVPKFQALAMLYALAALVETVEQIKRTFPAEVATK